MREKQHITVHKSNPSNNLLKVSVILLDWSCRERFHSFDWLNRQNVPRKQYELIWIELYDRVVPVAMEKADVVITCGQNGVYHKHMGYNIGLLHSKGKVVVICDSDAVFPEDFVTSIIKTFNLAKSDIPDSLVLMHYQWRSSVLYPDGLSEIEELTKYSWADLWPNVGACMSVSRSDAIRFGGFDEHKSFRGYICGPYDLGWRLINAGIPERWHDESVAIWHFSHPDPPATYGQSFSLKMWREKRYPHINHHALKAVEAFSTGRLLPIDENLEIYELRMQNRQIDTEFERKYSCLTERAGFSKWKITYLYILFFFEPFIQATKSIFLTYISHHLKKLIGPKKYEQVKSRLKSINGNKAN